MVLKTFKKTAMSDRYLDDYLSMIAIDIAVQERTKIAKMAAVTLHKLHNVMQQIKEWRDDSAKLKKNIWRMKMTLREDDKNDNQQIDPLIVHQRAEINRLEKVKDALEKEVANLKRTLAKAQEDIARITVREIGDKIAKIKNEFSDEIEDLNHKIQCLRKQLKETQDGQASIALKQFRELHKFAKGDRMMEMILANAISRVVETIVNLSEELVNVSKNLYRFKTKNRILHLELDRLRAILRFKSSNSSAVYRKRINELNSFAERLMEDLNRLEVINENVNYCKNLDNINIPKVIRNVDERLMNNSKSNFKNNREAMIAAGDPYCFKYMKKVVDLRVNLKVLSIELGRSNGSIYEWSSYEDEQYKKFAKTTLLLKNFLREIDIEISNIKIKPMDKYCRIGGISGSQYMTKVIELENMVKKSTAVIALIKQRPLEITTTAQKTTALEELENLLEQLCSKIQDFEIFDDCSNLRERINHLETSVIHLRLKLTEKNDCINALNKKYASIGSRLKTDRNKYETAIVNMYQENESLQEDVKKREQEMLELSHKCQHSEQGVAKMQLMKIEIDAARKKLQDLLNDKETLLRETGKMRDILGEKDKEIENIITRRNIPERVLRAEVEDLKMKLGIVSDENVKLKSIIERLENQEKNKRLDKLKSSDKKSGREDRDNSECWRDRARNLQDGLEHLKPESNESKGSSNQVNKPTIDNFKCGLDKAVDDRRTRLQDEISEFKSSEESLTHRLNIQTSADQETWREFERVMTEKKALESQVKHLENKKEELEAELSELRSKKELLDRSMVDVHDKCAAMQNEINKFKSERNGHGEKISEHQAVTRNFKLELEKARVEHQDAAIKIRRLKLENSRLTGDLNVLSSRSTEVEDRVRVLLTEKKDLTTRINELNDESIGLQDELNKAKTEKEYFSMELNKSRVENDRVEAKNALLQVTCDTKKSDNEKLRRERDDARERLDEIANECRMLENQLKIQRIKYETLQTVASTLHYENNNRKSYLKKIDTRYPLVKDHERGFADAHNKVRYKQNYSDAVQTSIKLEIGEQKDDETEFKAESDTCMDHDNKAKIKDKPKGELKRLRTENKALKLEPVNLRSKNLDIAIETAHIKDEFENSNTWTKESNDEKIIGCILKKLKILNICYKKEISNYSNYYNNSKILKAKLTSLSWTVNIDQLQVENRALKMEIDILHSNLNLSLMDGEKTKAHFGRATEEIQALKIEMMNLREEKVALRSQLEMFKEELNELKSERVALKDELAASRKSNFDLRLKAHGLRNDNEKLKETNVRLETSLQDVLKEISEYTVISGASNRNSRSNIESVLKDGPKDFIIVKGNFRTIKKRLNRFECALVKNSRLESAQENLEHIEGPR